MKLLILNGPNLNLLGTREPEIYGHITFDNALNVWREEYPEIELEYFQSNHEGDLIDMIQAADKVYDGIILNAGGYTHTSVAIHDAIAAIKTPVVEVHISNIAKREEYRHTSYISSVAVGSIIGLGLNVYKLAIEYFKTCDDEY